MSIVVPVEYVWCSGANTHHDLRSKVKSVTFANEADLKDTSKVLAALPEWNFDGSSTNQAISKDTEIIIKPVAVWPHPFIAAPAFVALAECFFPNGQPTPDNTRFKAREVFENAKAKEDAPWFGLEQEYVFYKDGRPLGWPETGTPAAQGPYYCSTGATVAWGRKYAQTHYLTCLKMGLTLSGTNAEVMPGQWEYQVGPCEGISSGDHAVMARWVFLRGLEEEGVDVNFESKPMKGDWNGSGMHTNFSTKAMRAPGGIEAIEAAIKRLSVNPLREIAVYGSDNDQRLSGHHETSRLDEFSHGVGTRHTSCRIPNQVLAAKEGYFEDRRPSGSADPWLVTARLYASSCDVPAPLIDEHGTKFAPAWLAALRK